MDKDSREDLKMKWYSGKPMKSGTYLCAVIGYDTPSILFYSTEQDCWYADDNEIYEVSHYMNLEDIPMPEGW